MIQVVGFILAVALLFAAFKLALILLVVAGLIFRTKQTVGLLLVGGTLAMLAAYPLAGAGLVALFAAVAIVRAVKGRPGEGQE